VSERPISDEARQCMQRILRRLVAQLEPHKRSFARMLRVRPKDIEAIAHGAYAAGADLGIVGDVVRGDVAVAELARWYLRAPVVDARLAAKILTHAEKRSS
jgi:hypothetical protein